MFKKLYFLPIFIALVLSSCDKVDFLPIIEEPIFVADIPFTKSDSININAGDDLYYMYASHTVFDDEIVYSGLFGKDESCESGCAENFSIKIHQKINEQERPNEGRYDYYSVPREGYKHNYTLITNDSNPIDNSTWRVGEVSLSGETISIDSNNDTAPGDGVRLIYNVPDVISVQFERQILPLVVDCDISLKISNTSQGVQLEVVNSSPFSQVSWSTGEIGKSILLNPNITTYTARVFAGSGCTTDIVINIKDFNLIDGFRVGFNQKSFGFETPDNSNNAVSISYTNEEGVFYTSSVIGQILPFSFEILEISDYEINELGDPTWKITAAFDCLLFGEDGSTKRVKNGNATFAVSHL